MSTKYQIPVLVAQDEPVVDERVKRVFPPWYRLAQNTVRVGGILFVFAVLLFGAAIAECVELVKNAPATHAGNHQVHP